MLETREEVNRYIDEEKAKAALKVKQGSKYIADSLDQIRSREIAEGAIASPVPEEIKPSSSAEVVKGGDTKVKKSGQAIDAAKKKSVQVKPDEGEKYKYTDRPVCDACGGTDVESHSPPEENKDGTFSHRWKCKNPDCKKKTFTVKLPPLPNN